MRSCKARSRTSRTLTVQLDSELAGRQESRFSCCVVAAGFDTPLPVTRRAPLKAAGGLCDEFDFVVCVPEK